MIIKLLLFLVVLMNKHLLSKAAFDPIEYYKIKILESNCSESDTCSDTYSFCFQNGRSICKGRKLSDLKSIGNCFQNIDINGTEITDTKRQNLQSGAEFRSFPQNIPSIGKLVVFSSSSKYRYPGCETGQRSNDSNKINMTVSMDDQSLLVQIEVVCKNSFCRGLKCDRCGKPPVVTILQSNYSSFKRQNVTFECTVSTNIYPLQQVYWIFTDKEGINRTINSTLNPEKYLDELRLNESKLTIFNLTSADRGTYQCQAENEVGTTSGFIQLNVTGTEPVIETNQHKINVTYGETVIIPCYIISAYPEVTMIYWTRNKNNVVNIINMSNHRYNGSTVEHPSLVISNVTQEDDGYYTCHAENLVGSGSSNTTRITVTGHTTRVYPITTIPTVKHIHTTRSTKLVETSSSFIVIDLPTTSTKKSLPTNYVTSTKPSILTYKPTDLSSILPKNKTTSLSFTFYTSKTPKSSKQSTVLPTEKSTILATPTVSREKSTEEKRITLIAGASAGGLVLIIILVVIIKMCKSRKSSLDSKHEMQMQSFHF